MLSKEDFVCLYLQSEDKIKDQICAILEARQRQPSREAEHLDTVDTDQAPS